MLKAPFPWFGGKSRAAHLVWRGFGDVPNYVEPFAGSLAVLLRRPHEAHIETVNDRDMYLANFWRAVQSDPAGVAFYADWPVNEADLHARHRWLVRQHEFRERMKHDPDFYDVKIAGWWVWGICMWIGGGWCAGSNWEDNARRPRGVHTAEEARRPHLHYANGVHAEQAHSRQIATAEVEGRPHLLRSKGVHRTNGSTEWEGRGAGGARRARGVQTAESAGGKRPHLSKAGMGVQRITLSQQMPEISGDRGASGRGILGSGESNGKLVDWMQSLAARLRRVRVCCGDWSRILGRSVTEAIGVTAVLLDPPYLATAGRDPSLYSAEDLTVANEVREWAIAHGDNRKLRIALCGYEGEHEMPDSWRVVSWKAVGGYASAAGNTENAHRERIWFSPHCREGFGPLFDSTEPTGRVA